VTNFETCAPLPNVDPSPASATTLCFPNSVAIRPSDGRLFLSDTENIRVLSWTSATAFTGAQPADVALGQPDFSSKLGTLGNTGLHTPAGLALDGSGRL
jgi:hypothetical protein